MDGGFRTPSFKTCPCLDKYVRITDPRWPVVREIARTLLRTTDVEIRGPQWLSTHVHELSTKIGDAIPSRTEFPVFAPSEGQTLALTNPNLPHPLVMCGIEEPDLTTIWLPMEAREAWEMIQSVADELLQAGYPGCLGCGGPNAEQPWDEVTSREGMRKSQGSRS